MLRFTLTLLTAALLIAAPASAATFAEAPPIAMKGFASCAGPTGPPGELYTTTPRGVRLLQASRAGLTPGASVDFSTAVVDCPAVATTANGAGVVVCCADQGFVAAALREPGGAWGMPSQLSPEDFADVEDETAAISERGDAVVAWKRPSNGATRLEVVRRAPGEAFQPPETLEAPNDGTISDVRTGVGTDGRAIVVWKLAAPRNGAVALKVAVVGADGAFGAPVRLADVPPRTEASLALSVDGRALIAVAGRTSLSIAERPAGGTFGALTRVAATHDPVAARTSAALAADGRAVITWTGVALGGVTVLTRPAGGPFSTPTVLAAGNRSMLDDLFLNAVYGGVSDVPGRWGSAAPTSRPR